MASLPDLIGRIRLDTSELDGVPGRARGALGGIATAAVAAGAAAAAGLAAFAAVGVKGAADVEAGLREVVTLLGETGGAAANSLQGFQKQTANLSNELGIAQDVLVKGLYQSISAGVPRENAFTFLEVASKASVAGVTDVATAVDGISTVVNAFGLDASDAQAASDSLFTAVKGGKTTFGELASSIANVAPAAAASKVSFQEVNAAIATLTAGGTSTAEATTQLKAALAGLQRPSKELDAIFQALGFTNAQTAIESKGLGFALDAVRDASGGSQGKLATLLGSTEAVAAANVLAGTGAAKFATEMAAQAASAGSTAEAFEVMGESVNRQMETAKVRFENAAIALGTVLLPAVTVIAGAVADFALFLAEEVAPAAQRFGETLGEVFGEVQEHSGKVGKALLVLAAIFSPTLALFGAQLAILAAAAVASSVRTVAAFVAKGAAAVASAVQANIAAARFIAALVRIAVAAAANAARVVASYVLMGAQAAAAGVRTAAAAAVMVAAYVRVAAQAMLAGARIAAAWLIALGPVGLVIAAVIGLVALIVLNFDKIKAVIGAAWGFIKTATSAAWAAIKGAVSAAASAISGAVSSAMNAAKGAVSAAWAAIRGATSGGISGVLSLVGSLPGRILGALGNLGSLLVGAGGDLLRGLASGISGAIGAVVERAKAAARRVVDGVKSALGISSPSKVMARQVGGPMAEGIAVGIERGIGDVRRALDDAVQLPDVSTLTTRTAGLGRAAGADVAPARAGDTYYVTVPVEVRDLAEVQTVVGFLDSLRLQARRGVAAHA